MNELKFYEPDININGHQLKVIWLTDAVDEQDIDDTLNDQIDGHILELYPREEDVLPEILAKLDDRCFRQFFKTSLDKFDLLDITSVCKHFKAFTSATINETVNYRDRIIPDICNRPMWCAENFFRSFGKSVLRLSSAWLNDVQCLLVRDRCPYIKEMKCCLFDHQTTDELRPLAARLSSFDLQFYGERLKIGDWYGSDVQLERLSIVLFYGLIVRLPNGLLPKLKELIISHVPLVRGETFFKHNPQLEKISFVRILDCDNPYMQKITFVKKKLINERNMMINIDRIMQHMKSAKTIQFYNEEDEVFTHAIKAIHRYTRSIENLKIHQDYFDDECKTKCIEHLCLLDEVKRLNLKELPITDDDFIRLAKGMKQLVELKIWTNSDSKRAPSISGIRRFMNEASDCVKKVTFIYQASNANYNNPLDENEIDVATQIARVKEIDFKIHLYTKNDILDVTELSVSMPKRKLLQANVVLANNKKIILATNTKFAINWRGKMSQICGILSNRFFFSHFILDRILKRF